MNILGINCVYHESSACLLKNGVLAAFMEEERLNRIKHAKHARIDNPDELPELSIDYCLKESHLEAKDIDYFAFNFLPEDRFTYCVKSDENHTLPAAQWGTIEGERLFYKKNLNVVPKLSAFLGQDVKHKCHFIPHHLAHAAGAYYSSGYEGAAILVVDGIGESKSTWLGCGKAKQITNFYEVDYPNSLGFLWEKMSEFLGFTEYDAHIVMGLSSYGDHQVFRSRMESLVNIVPNTFFRVNNDILLFRTNDFSQLEELFGVKKRNYHDPIEKVHSDIAAALQYVTQEIMMYLSKEVRNLSGEKRLCMAGGVALNCVANGKIFYEKIFDEMYIQPPSNDAGGSIGAAMYVWAHILNNPCPKPIDTVYLGPSFSEEEVVGALRQSQLKYQKVDNLISRTAKELSEGKIVAWFHGKMEAGPRALGHRSLLADPRKNDMRDIINKKVKYREQFRPLCPSVLEEEVKDWFFIGDRVPNAAKYMLMAFKVDPQKKMQIPAVVHVDDTSRIQAVNKTESPRFWELIHEFHKITGVPMLLNTSFNTREPIVCTPEHAIKTFSQSKVDYLVLEDYLCTR